MVLLGPVNSVGRIAGARDGDHFNGPDAKGSIKGLLELAGIPPEQVSLFCVLPQKSSRITFGYRFISSRRQCTQLKFLTYPAFEVVIRLAEGYYMQTSSLFCTAPKCIQRIL